jgi:predicted small integral membrane protein
VVRSRTQPRILGALLLTGWAVYLTVVVASNTTDLLMSFGWIHTSFESGNLAFIDTATKIYFRSQPVSQVLLGGVIVWEALGAALLWRGATLWYRGNWTKAAIAQVGLIVATLLWIGFAITTEVFIAYARGVNESAYWTLAVATMATLLVVMHFGGEPT